MTATTVSRSHASEFRPASLDAINFLLADVRGALGPFLNIFVDLSCRPAGVEPVIRRPDDDRASTT
jgi:hypothetical protein